MSVLSRPPSGPIPLEFDAELCTPYRSRFLPAGSHYYKCTRFDPDRPVYRGPLKSLKPELLESALSGGFPLLGTLVARGQCTCVGFDFDKCENQQFWTIPDVLASTGAIDPESILLLRSGRPAGAHVFLPLDRAVHASAAALLAHRLGLRFDRYGILVDHCYPDRSQKLGIRLPGMVNPKYAQMPQPELGRLGARRADQLYDARTRQPVDPALQHLVSSPPVGVEQLIAWANEAYPSEAPVGSAELEIRDAGLATLHVERVRPCIRTFLLEPIRVRELRHRRALGIAADLARINLSRENIENILVDWFDRCYHVSGGTRARQHHQEASAMAKRAADGSLRFNCKHHPDIYGEYCVSTCPRKGRSDGVSALEFPAFNPNLSELGALAGMILARHMATSAIAERNGHPLYFLSAEQERLNLCSENAARSTRKILIEKGYILHIPTEEVPEHILIENGHDRVHPRCRPTYYQLNTSRWKTPSDKLLVSQGELGLPGASVDKSIPSVNGVGSLHLPLPSPSYVRGSSIEGPLPSTGDLLGGAA